MELRLLVFTREDHEVHVGHLTPCAEEIQLICGLEGLEPIRYANGLGIEACGHQGEDFEPPVICVVLQY